MTKLAHPTGGLRLWLSTCFDTAEATGEDVGTLDPPCGVVARRRAIAIAASNEVAPTVGSLGFVARL